MNNVIFKEVDSWGSFARSKSRVQKRYWSCEKLAEPVNPGEKILAYGLGRSYGDCCQNNNGIIIDCHNMNRILFFDPETGRVKAEAGLCLDDLLSFCVPRGWFLHVTPGTKFVTLGGAIANDVHGKNHHQAGTFGNFVSRFELLRSDGTKLICSETENSALFNATIGGLGLTGLITWVEMKLKPIRSSAIVVETIKVVNFDEFLAITKESDTGFEYTVAWLDGLASGKNLGRGIFMRGNHAVPEGVELCPHRKPLLSIPMDFPELTLNRWTIRAFNFAYYRKQQKRRKRSSVHYDSFFYPLDSIGRWNRIYGGRGFFQYQFVIPNSERQEPVREIMRIIASSGEASFLAVMKSFGTVPSKGMLSFPIPGVTIAMDFPNRGQSTLHMMQKLDQVVMEAGGRLYPAKDARMSGHVFRKSYPNWEKFCEHIDPKFSSDFWRRVTWQTDGNIFI